MDKNKEKTIEEKYDVDTKYDALNVDELQKRLNRPPTAGEIINSDKDNDLVNEVMWQLIKELSQQIKDLETKLTNKGVV